MSVLQVGRVAGLCMLAAIGSGAVHAEDWKPVGEFGWFGVGKAHELEKGHYYWVGEFSGTFFNDKGEGSLFHKAGVKCPAFFDLFATEGRHTAGGYCVIADGDGDRAHLSWAVKGDGRRATGTYTFTGGTGKYNGIKGTNNFSTLIQVNWPDGTTTGFASWNK